MKIRIKGNSIRYRLTRPEVEIFCKTGFFTETTVFGEGIFTYTLQANYEVNELNACLGDNTITMYFPGAEKDNWAHNAKVGFEHSMQLNNGTALFLLVEKDFVCLDETIEDQSNNYPRSNGKK
ncbi:MAG: hypothetical protein WBG90_11970 [Saonia sp.]